MLDSFEKKDQTFESYFSSKYIKFSNFFFNHEAKKYKKKSKTYKIINDLIQSIDGVLLLGVSSKCITLGFTGVGLIVVPIASDIGAGVSIFSKFIGEYLKSKEQHNLKKYTLAGGTFSKNYIQKV